MSDYWNRQTEGFNRGLGNIGTALISGPRMRAQASLMRAQMSEQQQMAEEAAARARLIGTQADHISTGDKRLDDYGSASQAYAAAQTAYQSSPTPENKAALDKATSDFYGSGAKVNNMKVGEIVTALGKSGALQNLVSGSPDFKVAGGMQGQAASIADNDVNAAERAARPMNITGTLVSPDGKVLATVPPKSAAEMPDYTTEEVKQIPNPAYKASGFGKTNVPPTISVTNRTTRTVSPRSGSVLTNALAAAPVAQPDAEPPQERQAAPQAPAAAPAPVQAPATQTVRVQHPDGRTGVIPASNLKAAIAQGYKLIQE